MLIILYMLIDLIKSKKKKVLSFLTLIINLILLLFSGARTPLLAILIILLFLPLIINIDTKNILRLCSIVVIFCIIVLIIINNKNVQIRNSDITMFGTRGLTTRIQHLSRINSDLSLETIILGKGLYVTEPPIDLFWYNIFLYFGVFGIFNYGSIIMLSIIRLKKISHNNISNEIIFDKMIITIISFSISLFTTNIIASFPLNFIYFSMLGLSYNDLSLKSNTYYEK